MKLFVEKETGRRIDSDNLNVIVTLMDDQHNTIITGQATCIISAEAYHLDSDFEDRLDAMGIYPDDVQDALEDGAPFIVAEIKEPTRPLAAQAQRIKLDSYTSTSYSYEEGNKSVTVEDSVSRNVYGFENEKDFAAGVEFVLDLIKEGHLVKVNA